MKIIIFAEHTIRVEEISNAVIEAMPESVINPSRLDYNDTRDLFFGPPILELETVCFLFENQEAGVLNMYVMRKKLMEKLGISAAQVVEATQWRKSLRPHSFKEE